MVFYIPVYLTQNKRVRVKELSNNEFKVIQKTILLGIDHQTAEVFECIIKDHIHPDDIHNKLNAVDKLIILTKLRECCIDPDLHFVKDNANIIVSMSDVLSNIDIDITPKIYNIGKYQIYLGVKKNLYYHDMDDMLCDCIWGASIDNGDIIAGDDILELPGILGILRSHMLYMTEYDIIVIPKHLNKLGDVKLSINDNSYISFLSFIFKSDLMIVYEIEYCFVSKLNLGSKESFDKMTPIESRILINISQKYNEPSANS